MLLDHHLTSHLRKQFFQDHVYIYIIARSAASLHQIHTGSRKYMCKQRSAKIVETIPKTYKRNKNTPAHMGHISFLSWNPSLACCPALDPSSSSWARNWSATRPQFWAKFRTLHRRREFFQWHCCLLSEQCTVLKEKDGWRQEPKLEAPFHIYLGLPRWGYVREYPHKNMGPDGPDISTGNLEPWS